MRGRACSTQTRRHSYLVSLLGIRHVVLAINKMDLVDWSRGTASTRSSAPTAAFAEKIGDQGLQAIPMSALKGDNITEPSAIALVSGPPLLRWLEDAPVEDDLREKPFRMPVQWVNRPNLDFRGFSGLICLRGRPTGRQGQGPALRPREPRGADRHLHRRPPRGGGGAIGDADAGRRDRRQPRR